MKCGNHLIKGQNYHIAPSMKKIYNTLQFKRNRGKIMLNLFRIAKKDQANDSTLLQSFK